MASKRKTVKQLAEEAHIDTDEALIALWDAGYDNVVGPNDTFGPRELNRARRALGIATRRELKTLAYWIKLLKLDDSELKTLLRNKGVSVGDKVQKLQSKGISRLKAEARKRGIDPITGGIIIQPSIRGKIIELPAFEWRTPGHKHSLRWLSEEEVCSIHFELVNDFSSSPDPIIPHGVQSESLLASAVFRPQTSLGGTLKYDTIETSAAALLHSIIHDHPFHNGNKRTALVSTLVFLDENGFLPLFDENEAFKIVMQLAQHQIVNPQLEKLADREVLAVADWLCPRCRIIEKGERLISFRKLRNILTSYNCEVEYTHDKVNFIRIVKEQGILLSKVKKLHIQVPYSGEGQDVPMAIIKKIRKELHLDEPHGIDSHDFYNKEHINITDFIVRYRKTLRRLAKF
jgi:death-on-curing family protein